MLHKEAMKKAHTNAMRTNLENSIHTPTTEAVEQEQQPGEEEEDKEEKDTFAIPTAAPTMKAPATSSTPTGKKKRDFSPVSWDQYFESANTISVSEGNIFRVYRTGTSGPLLVLLHGGGMSALSWSLMTKEVLRLCCCRVLAIDLRGHGDSVVVDSDNFSLEALSNDVINVLSTLFPEEQPPITLVGHSMGGAVAIHVATLNKLPTLSGLIVIDVVEGTALEALSSMNAVIRNRPRIFKSIPQAIEWSLRSGQTRNVDAARVAMPALIKPVGSSSTPNFLALENDSFAENQAMHTPDVQYEWKVDLTKTEPFWKEWFTGLSDKFLNARCSKLLILAGMDRLDKQLTIGQMQGKFQLELLPECGHAIHEDAPEKVGGVIAQYLVRNKYAIPTEAFQAEKRPGPLWLPK